jgi:hypothetical protein
LLDVVHGPIIQVPIALGSTISGKRYLRSLPGQL